jgi:hypothetical protein
MLRLAFKFLVLVSFLFSSPSLFLRKDEFDFQATNLAVDLRGGERLARLTEILCGKVRIACDYEEQHVKYN